MGVILNHFLRALSVSLCLIAFESAWAATIRLPFGQGGSQVRVRGHQMIYRNSNYHDFLLADDVEAVGVFSRSPERIVMGLVRGRYAFVAFVSRDGRYAMVPWAGWDRSFHFSWHELAVDERRSLLLISLIDDQTEEQATFVAGLSYRPQQSFLLDKEFRVFENTPPDMDGSVVRLSNPEAAFDLNVAAYRTEQFGPYSAPPGSIFSHPLWDQLRHVGNWNTGARDRRHNFRVVANTLERARSGTATAEIKEIAALITGEPELQHMSNAQCAAYLVALARG